MTVDRVAGEAQVTHLLDANRAIMAPGALPDTADVAIIGGGIVGCATAWFLARRGIRVVLFEKGRIACEQSGRNWGWVRQQGRASAELPMMMRSIDIWRRWTEELGEDTGFVQGGCLYLAHSDDELQKHSAWLAIADGHGLETRVLNGSQLSDVMPGDTRHWAGALYTPGDGRAEPGRATPAIARAAISAGAGIWEQCAVRGIERAAGRVSAVITERGTVRTSSVVCAAGAWTSLFAGSVGVTVPQLKIKGTVARTAPAANILNGTAWAPEVAIRRRRDGGYTVAHGSLLEHTLVPASMRFGWRFLPAFKQDRDAIRFRLGRDFFRELAQPRRWSLDEPTVFERNRVLHPAPTPRVLQAMRTALQRSFPDIANAPFVETWAGMIEASPDLIPIIGPAAELPGLYLATGFSGHGFGLGPGAAECLASMIAGENPPVDMQAFRPQRFFDGSHIQPGPTI